MKVFDYMINEICETKRANKRLTKALIVVASYGAFSLVALTKQLQKEQEKVQNLKKEIEEVYELCRNNSEVEVVDDGIDIPKGE